MKSPKRKGFLYALHRMLSWWFQEIPTCKNSTTEIDTGYKCAFVNYEINVAVNGKHVFATDTHIRTYSPTEIVALVKLFQTSFPDARIIVTAFGKHAPALPAEIQDLLK